MEPHYPEVLIPGNSRGTGTVWPDIINKKGIINVERGPSIPVPPLIVNGGMEFAESVVTLLLPAPWHNVAVRPSLSLSTIYFHLTNLASSNRPRLLAAD